MPVPSSPIQNASPVPTRSSMPGRTRCWPACRWTRPLTSSSSPTIPSSTTPPSGLPWRASRATSAPLAAGRHGAGHPGRDGRRAARQDRRAHEVRRMTPVALDGRRLSAEAIDGSVLAETILAPDDHHRVLLPKGRILHPEDLTLIERARPRELHVVRLDPGDVHEDAAARRLAAAVAGPGITVHGPVESQMRLAADINGILRIDVARLDALNGIPDMSVFTLFDGQLVSRGKTVAGVKITPFATAESNLAEAERTCAGAGGIVRVVSFKPMRVGVLVRERLESSAREKFQSSLQMKVAWFGSSIIGIDYVADDVDAVTASLRRLVGGADLILTAGA